MCIFESDTVKSDCPLQECLRFHTDCWFTLIVLLFVLDIKKKKTLKMTSQLVIFRAFFFRPPDPKSEKNPVNQLINLAL